MTIDMKLSTASTSALRQASFLDWLRWGAGNTNVNEVGDLEFTNGETGSTKTNGEARMARANSAVRAPADGGRWSEYGARGGKHARH